MTGASSLGFVAVWATTGVVALVARHASIAIGAADAHNERLIAR
jgi:hypothetical protein